MKDPEVCPIKVHLTVKAWGEDSHFKDLWFIIIRRKCIVRLEMGDCSLTTQTIRNADRIILGQALLEMKNTITKCSLEFCGYLRQEDVALLPPCTTRLHLLLIDTPDIEVLQAVTMRLDNRDLHLEELHVSVDRSIKFNDVQELKMSFLKTRFCLHFPKARDQDVEWIAKITAKMDYPSISYVKSVDEIFLPESSLSVAGTRRLLRKFTKLCGFSQKYPVFLESKSIHEASKLDLVEEYVSSGSNITFDVSLPDREISRTRVKAAFKHWLFLRRHLEEYLELLCLLLLFLLLAQMF